MADKDTNNNPHMPIEESIRSATQIFEKALETNDIEDALQQVEPFCDKSIYHNFLKSVGLIVIAVSTMEQPDMEKASKAVAGLRGQTNKIRKKGFMVSALKMIKSPNYQKYSDLEIHAELMHTFYIAMSALVIALETYNVYGLVKVAYRLQKFMIKFKGCRSILKKRKEWENETSRVHFEAGVRLANGLKNLAISQIPPKILRIVNLLGLKGKESVGFSEINKVAFDMQDCTASRMARMFLVAYWLFAQPHAGLGPKELPNAEKVLNKELERFPKSIVFLGGKAKLDQVSGRIDLAIQKFAELLNNSFEKSHKAFHWELMWSHALKQEWDECIKYAELVRKGSEHSPTVTTYAEAVFRYVKSIDDADVTQKQTASKLMEAIPGLRIRHLGKTITPEKIAVETSIKYFKNNEFLILPEMDMLYNLNWFVLIKEDKDLLNKWLARADKQVNHFKDDLNKGGDLDNYLSALFYKSVINKLLGNHAEAKDGFTTITKNESRIAKEKSIPGQAALELGLNELAQGNHDEAKKWLDKCLKDYSHYLNENFVHLRVYAGLREMGISTDKDKEDATKMEQYKKEWLKEINVEEKSYETLVQTEDAEVGEGDKE